MILDLRQNPFISIGKHYQIYSVHRQQASTKKKVITLTINKKVGTINNCKIVYVKIYINIYLQW